MQAEQPRPRRRVLRRYGAADREQLIQAQAQSGLSIKGFCEREGIKPWTFYGWTKKSRALQRRPRFAEVQVAPCLVAAVEVLLPNGARIGIRHQGKREELVAFVREVAGC
jgi:transposase-like protein